MCGTFGGVAQRVESAIDQGRSSSIHIQYTYFIMGVVHDCQVGLALYGKDAYADHGPLLLLTPPSPFSSGSGACWVLDLHASEPSSTYRDYMQLAECG